MKLATIIFALIFAHSGATSTFAQSAPPPPPSPAYFPESWKEFTYENDNVKIRFPKEPKITAKPENAAGMKARQYDHESFIRLNLSVVEAPANSNFEEMMPARDFLLKLREGILEEIKQYNPQIIKEADTTVSGHEAKFLHVEGNHGEVLRAKFFVVKNRIYIAMAKVKKGQRHGSNYENDFEKVAMAFLDSVQLVAPKQ